MKKGKYTLTVSSDDKHVLECFHSWMVNDAEQQCLIPDEATGNKLFYPNIDWNHKNRKDLDLYIECDYEHEYE